MNIKKWMVYVLIIFGLITATFYISSFFIDNDVIEIIGVTLLTTYYQACIRPLTGSFINLKYQNKMNYNSKWFKTSKFEEKIYKLLNVKKWKNYLPTYDKKIFDLKTRSLEEVASAMCQAEVVHELMFIEALFPLLLIIPYGRPVVFILTTLMCIIIESVFIITQRYNRPRIIKLIKLKETRKKRSLYNGIYVNN